MDGMALSQIQKQLPWGKFYSEEFKLMNSPSKDFQHALWHVTKALGKLAGIIDDADHGDTSFPRADVEKYLADIVICAVRAASVNPSGSIDIGEAVVGRIESKNEVKLIRQDMLHQAIRFLERWVDSKSGYDASLAFDSMELVKRWRGGM
jgi:hypothetical protein